MNVDRYVKDAKIAEIIICLPDKMTRHNFLEVRARSVSLFSDGQASFSSAR